MLSKILRNYITIYGEQQKPILNKSYFLESLMDNGKEP